MSKAIAAISKHKYHKHGFFFILAVLVLLFIALLYRYNSTAESFLQTATVKVLKALSVEEVSAMNFGIIQQPPAGQQLIAILTPEGRLDAASTITDIDGTDRSAGIYTITGSPAAANTVTIGVSSLSGGGAGLKLSSLSAELEGNSGSGGSGDGTFSTITLGTGGHGIHPTGIDIKMGAALTVDGDTITDGGGTV